MSIQDQNKQQSKNVSRSYERPHFPSFNELATIKFNTGFPLHRQQFCSMFIKRALFSWRNWKLILLQIIVILVVTTYLLIALKLSDIDMPSREMDLSHYGRTIVPYSVSGNSDLALNVIKNLEILLKPKNQELRKVKGKTHKKKRDCCYLKTFCHLQRKNLTMVFSYFFSPPNCQYHRSN